METTLDPNNNWFGLKYRRFRRYVEILCLVNLLHCHLNFPFRTLMRMTQPFSFSNQLRRYSAVFNFQRFNLPILVTEKASPLAAVLANPTTLLTKRNEFASLASQLSQPLLYSLSCICTDQPGSMQTNFKTFIFYRNIISTR